MTPFVEQIFQRGYGEQIFHMEDPCDLIILKVNAFKP